ncbi:MAG: sulfate permease [Actinobacteria bacterium]|nr:sulfate permease [Actinomycetota bacterium]
MKVSERGHDWFQYAPTNLLINAIRYRRRGLKWGIPAMIVLGGGYIYGMAICYTIITREGPGPLNLLILLFFWNALKFLWTGPVSLIDLTRVRAQERRQRRESMHAAVAPEDYSETLA